MYVTIKDFPAAVQQALKDIGYNRTDIQVTSSETFTQQAQCTTRGSRAFTAVINLETGKHLSYTGSWGGSNMFNPDNAVDNDDCPRPLPKGFMVIHGTSGYKGTFGMALVHPDNFAALLPADKTNNLTEDQTVALGCLKTLNSRGRKEYFQRNGWSTARLDATLNSLESQGLCKRSSNGATKITTAGRNAWETIADKPNLY